MYYLKDPWTFDLRSGGGRSTIWAQLKAGMDVPSTDEI